MNKVICQQQLETIEELDLIQSIFRVFEASDLLNPQYRNVQNRKTNK